MFTFWDFAFIIGAIAIVAATVVGFKFLVRPSYRFTKNKLSLRKQKKLEKASQQTATLSNTKKIEDNFTENQSKNFIHTTENYNLITETKTNKYQSNKAKEEFLQNNLESNPNISSRKSKLLYKTKQQLASSVKNPESETLQLDYVKDNNNSFEKTTYIQIFDDEKTKDFKKLAESDQTEGLPYVYKLEFGKNSNKKPLRVSSPSKEVFEIGAGLILDKVKEDLGEIESDATLNSCFPITETYQYGKEVVSKTYSTEKELYDRIVGETEEQTK